jgi:hypothetical protein
MCIQENSVVIRDLKVCREATKAQRCLRILKEHPKGYQNGANFVIRVVVSMSYISSREGVRMNVQSSHYLVGIITLASQGETGRTGADAL